MSRSIGEREKGRKMQNNDPELYEFYDEWMVTLDGEQAV